MTARTRRGLGWPYLPTMQTGLNRPYERFDIVHITPPDTNNGYGIDTGSRPKFLAVVRSQPSKLVTEANARLMAAAPELLAALETLREDMRMLQAGDWVPDEDSTQASIDLADAAINAAKG